MPRSKIRSITNKVQLTPKNKRIAAAAVIVVLAVVVLATNTYLIEGCILGNYAYAGQAVDAEQALAKLEGFAGNIDRTKFNANPDPVSTLDFGKTAVEKAMGIKAMHDTGTIMLSGFVFSVPQKNASVFSPVEGFYLSDTNGNLYSLKDARCV